MENRARDKKLFALPSFSHRVDVLFSIRTPSLSVSRRVFTYLRSFRYRASTFAVHLILRLSSSSSSFPPPPLSSLPPSSSSSSSSSASSSSSFSTFDQRRRLVALLSSSSLSSFSFFFPPLLFLRSRTIKPPPPPTTHSVPLQCCERRCRHARRLIFGRTFRFGVLYWTVQKWHLPVSELTSCQVSMLDSLLLQIKIQEVFEKKRIDAPIISTNSCGCASSVYRVTHRIKISKLSG